MKAIAGELHEADTGDLIEALDHEIRPRFIELMGRAFDFTALTEVDDTVREEILEELKPEAVAEGVRDLDSDDAAYILEDLPKKEQVEVLDQLPLSERQPLERILLYPEGSAGRRMQTEFIAVPPDWTVGDAIDHMRDWALGTNGKWVTMGIPSQGWYGIPKEVMFGFPVTCANGEYKVIEGLEIDAFSQQCINKTLKELQEEQAGVAHLL